MWSNPVGNPASLYPNEVRHLFGAAFRADHIVRKSIIGFDVPALEQVPPDIAYHAGFGSLYWMEGVAFRLQVRRRPLPPTLPLTLPLPLSLPPILPHTHIYQCSSASAGRPASLMTTRTTLLSSQQLVCVT